MRGITNAPQGSGGGSGGGEWTERTNNQNWTDLFEIGGSNLLTAKKDMFLYSTDNNYKFAIFIPKGFTPHNDTIHIGAAYVMDSSGDNIKLACDVRLSTGYMSSGSYFNCITYMATFTTDGSTVTVNKTMGSYSIYKSSIKVWVKE